MPGQNARVGRSDKELETKEAMRPGSGSRVRNSQFDICRKISGESLVEVLKGELGKSLVTAFAGDKGGVTEGREAELAPEFEFLVSKPFVVMVPCELNRGRVGSEGLDDHFPLHFTTSGTAGNLGK